MTHKKLKIVGSIAGVALGVVLGWLSLEWLFDAVESDDVRLMAANLGEKLWVQLKFSFISSLIGLSVFWGAVAGRRWNFWARLSVLSIVAIGTQWTVAFVKVMHIASGVPDGTEEMPASIFFGDLGAEWIPLATAVLVWSSVVPLLFVPQPDALTAISHADAERSATEDSRGLPAGDEADLSTDEQVDDE